MKIHSYSRIVKLANNEYVFSLLSQLNTRMNLMPSIVLSSNRFYEQNVFYRLTFCCFFFVIVEHFSLSTRLIFCLLLSTHNYWVWLYQNMYHLGYMTGAKYSPMFNKIKNVMHLICMKSFSSNHLKQVHNILTFFGPFFCCFHSPKSHEEKYALYLSNFSEPWTSNHVMW